MVWGGGGDGDDFDGDVAMGKGWGTEGSELQSLIIYRIRAVYGVLATKRAEKGLRRIRDDICIDKHMFYP